ncbi:MAG: conjugal transfer protein [Lachnospiraceae bacterium]|nr:conjugal transfer protein [Lachnospiraceae bacterium]
MNTFRWFPCPICKYPKMLKLRSDTKLINFPGYCKRCKTESLITTEPEP